MRVLEQRRFERQSIDGAFHATFAKEVLAAPLPRGGAIGLVRKRLAVGGPPRATVLLIHGYAQNRYAWHLSRRSFSSYLAAAGYDVWNVDMRGGGRSRALGAPTPRHFEDHVGEDIPAALDTIRAATGARATFLVGHSLGAAVACAVAGRHPEMVRGVVTLAGLWFFGRRNRFIRFLGATATTLRSVLPFRLDEGLALPTDRVGRLLAISRVAWDSRLSRLSPLAAWAPGSCEADIIAESVRRSFERASLGITLGLASMALGGTFCDRRGTCYLAAFCDRDVPLLVACGSEDALISIDDARGAYDLSRSRDKTLLCLDGRATGGRGFGHIDVIMGRAAPRVVWPAVRRWMDER